MANKYAHLTIYMALGMESNLISRLHYQSEDILDGGWQPGQEWSPDRNWALYSIPRLLAGWHGRPDDNHYTYVLQRMRNASLSCDYISESHGVDGFVGHGNRLHLAKRKRKRA